MKSDPTDIDLEKDLAVEADDDSYYDPDENSNVVTLEPKIITIGRKEKRAVQKMQDTPSNQ